MAKHRISPSAKEFIRKRMRAFDKGKMKTSRGTTVRNSRQALAIAFSEARQKGMKVPPARKRRRK